MIRGCWHHPPRSNSLAEGWQEFTGFELGTFFEVPEWAIGCTSNPFASGVTSRHFVEDSKMFSQLEGCSILTTILWPKPHSSSPILGTTIESAYIIFASQMKACDILVGMGLLIFVCR